MPTILITGASRGIGLELARQAADDGWTIHACCRRPEAASDLQGLAAASAGHVVIHRLDVTDAARLGELADSLKQEPIDILLSNAGTFGPREATFGHTDDAAWLDAFRVNTIAALHVAEAFADNVARSDRRIIATMSSKMGSVADNTSGGHYIYRSSKAALNIVTKSMAVDLKDRGITVVALHPGWVRTDMGGPQAPLSVKESVTGLRSVLDALGLPDTGRFFGYDGVEVPW